MDSEWCAFHMRYVGPFLVHPKAFDGLLGAVVAAERNSWPDEIAGTCRLADLIYCLHRDLGWGHDEARRFLAWLGGCAADEDDEAFYRAAAKAVALREITRDEAFFRHQWPVIGHRETLERQRSDWCAARRRAEARNEVAMSYLRKLGVALSWVAPPPEGARSRPDDD
jgi:hypothetical protein